MLPPTNPTARALLEMFDALLVVKQGPDRTLINYHGSEVIRALGVVHFDQLPRYCFNDVQHLPI